MDWATRNHKPEAKEFARSFRKNMDAAERLLWFFLRKKRLGYAFRRQAPVGPYVLDFYCPAASLAIEIDGEYHVDRREQDLRRDDWLRSRGIETMRIPSGDIYADSKEIDRWLEALTALCRQRAEHDP